MKNRIMKNWMMALVVSVWIPVVQADLIASYGFNDVLSASGAPTEITAGDVSRGPGVSKDPGYSNVSYEGTKSAFFNNAGFNSTEESAAITNNRYLSFSVSVNAESQVSYTNFSMAFLRKSADGAGAPDSFAIRSSADGFEQNIGSGAIPAASTDTFSTYSFDWSQKSSLQSVTNQVEFRVYLWASQGIGTDTAKRVFKIDDWNLQGSVNAIPEPATLGLFVISSASVLMLRRGMNK